jgi:hypothetical protein
MMQRSPYYAMLITGVLLTVAGIHPAAGQYVNDQERILSFKAYYTIEENGDMLVKEKIRVRVRNQKINHGILRIIPLLTNRGEYLSSVSVIPSSALKNGIDEPMTVHDSPENIKIQLGRESNVLAPGDYEYEINYAVQYPVWHHNGSDQFYWNVTGNDWDLTMDSVEAVVSLPPKAFIDTSRLVAYSGPAGTDFANCKPEKTEAHQVIFRVYGLYFKHGLTVSVRFSPGVIAYHDTERYYDWRKEGRKRMAYTLGISGLLFLLTVRVLKRKIRKNDLRTTFPTLPTLPSFSVSPAAVLFLKKMSYDPSVMMCAIVSMAVKKYLSIKEVEGFSGPDVEIRAISKDTQVLSADEKVLAGHLFSTSSVLQLRQTGKASGWLSQAFKAHRDFLDVNLIPDFFRRNTGLKVFFVLVMIASLQYAFEPIVPGINKFIAYFLTVFVLAGTLGVIGGFSAATTNGVSKAGLVVCTVGTMFWFGTLGFLFYMMIDIFYIGYLILFSLAAIFLLKTLNSYRGPGLQVLEQMENFKKYITSYNLVTPVSPGYAKSLPPLLPYAIATDHYQQYNKLLSAQGDTPDTDSTFKDLLAIAGSGALISGITHAAIDSTPLD